MSLIEKLETDVELKGSAEQFHEVFCGRPHHISNVSPAKIQGVELHEGEWGKEGSIICWNYVHDGKAQIAKELVEKVDPVKNLVTFKVIEGDLLNEFKSFKATVQATPKGNCCVAHWTFEYEKLHPGVSHPEALLEFAAELSKEIDAHVTSAN
ncbi:hypothetical protein SLE2022_172330 [Rubroshorea leprosula]